MVNKMTFFKRNKWALLVLGGIVLIGVIAMPMTSVVAISNVWVMLSLVFLMVGAFFILEKAHLFAGWRRRRRKGEDPLPEERIKVTEVASVKNGPVIVNRYARFCLIVGVGLLVLGIVVTL